MADQPTSGGGSQPSKPPPWNDPAVRSIVFQALALVVLGWFFWTILNNTLANMENARHLHRFRLPRPGRRVRHPDESYSLRREQHLWPDFRRRSAQYGPGRLPGDHFGDHSRIRHRCRAAVQQLGDRQIGGGLCRSHPQHSPAVADFLLVHRGASGAARHPPEHHIWRLVLSQQPGLLLSKTHFR